MGEDAKKCGKYKDQDWIEFLKETKERKRDRETSMNDMTSIFEEDLKEAMRKGASEKAEDLLNCHKEYEEAVSGAFFNKSYLFLDEKDLRLALSICKVMVITANPIEKAMLHFKIANEGEKIFRVISGRNAYFIFKWGEYWVAHVHQGETGANKDMGTNSTICDALTCFIPNVIISLGIAFGIDYTKQQIGDVLVSRRILPYSDNKLDRDELKPDRSQDKTIDNWLQVRLVNAAEFMDNVTYGDILTGGSVLSSLEEKDKICLGYTEKDFLIGGEMEGNAVFQTAKRVGIPGVVIKGICDWGVAKNSIFSNCLEDDNLEDDEEEPSILKNEEVLKESLQAFAMKNAIEACFLLVKDKGLFSSPKYENVARLKRKNKVANCTLIVNLIAQLLLFIFNLSRLILNSRNDFYQILLVFNSPFFLILSSAVLMIVCSVSLVVGLDLSNKKPEKILKKILKHTVQSGKQ